MNEIGFPQLPENYWQKKTDNKDSISAINTEYTLKELTDISLFNNKKKI